VLFAELGDAPLPDLSSFEGGQHDIDAVLRAASADAKSPLIKYSAAS